MAEEGAKLGVAPVPRGPLLVIITYHLAQFLILIGLIRSS